MDKEWCTFEGGAFDGQQLWTVPSEYIKMVEPFDAPMPLMSAEKAEPLVHKELLYKRTARAKKVGYVRKWHVYVLQENENGE